MHILKVKLRVQKLKRKKILNCIINEERQQNCTANVQI